MTTNNYTEDSGSQFFRIDDTQHTIPPIVYSYTDTTGV